MNNTEWINGHGDSYYVDLAVKASNWLGLRPKRVLFGAGHHAELEYQKALYAWRQTDPDPLREAEYYRAFHRVANPGVKIAMTSQRRTDRNNAYVYRHRLKKSGVDKVTFTSIVKSNPAKYWLTPENVDAWVKSVFSKDRK